MKKPAFVLKAGLWDEKKGSERTVPVHREDVPSSKILVNVGDEKITKNEDIRNFNVVGKGREGWNCRSLFSVAMFRSPQSKIFVLQATMRCLRKITDEQLTATVFLSKENYDTLDAELNKNFNGNKGHVEVEWREVRAFQGEGSPPSEVYKAEEDMA